jgi:hypothetical protein
MWLLGRCVWGCGRTCQVSLLVRVQILGGKHSAILAAFEFIHSVDWHLGLSDEDGLAARGVEVLVQYVGQIEGADTCGVY